jgi:hypothetical protein
MLGSLGARFASRSHSHLDGPGRGAVIALEEVAVDAERDIGLPCPRRRLITTTSRPAAMSAEAWVCRSA